MLVSVSPPSQDQQTAADKGTFHSVSNTAPSLVIECVAPSPVVFHAAPAPVIECSALYKIGQEHTHSYIRKRRKKRSDKYDDGHFFFCLIFLLFFFKITRHSNNFEFSKLPSTNLENGCFPAIF